MSQRRTTAVPVESLSIDQEKDDNDNNNNNNNNNNNHNETTTTRAPLSIEERYQTEKHHLRLKHWRESPFAAGLTEPTWMAERYRPSEKSQAYGDSELEPDSTGCLCLSAQVCPLLGASRVGNMAVLKMSHEWVEEVTVSDDDDDDEEEDDLEQAAATTKTRRYRRPTLAIVVGPYWPMVVFVTYPLIFCVSGWTFVAGILPGNKPVIIVFVWLVCTVGLILALTFTACCDPGIMYRHRNPPPQGENTWRWVDQAQTYRPRGAYYDVDSGVVVEGFDHTCPWTGTAIGKRNFFAFQMFVCLVFVCMIMDIFILTGAM